MHLLKIISIMVLVVTSFTVTKAQQIPLQTAKERYSQVQAGTWDPSPYRNRKFRGCEGIGTIGKKCLAFMWVNGLLEKDDYDFFPGQRLYWAGKTFVAPDSILVGGPCCTLQWFEGHPCPDGSGYCDVKPLPTKPDTLTPKQPKLPPFTFKKVEVDTPKVKPCPTTSLTEKTICEGDSVLFAGLWRKVQGIYTDKSDTTNTKVLALFVNQPSFANIDTAITEGDSVLFKGLWRKMPGTYRDTVIGSNGCDSIVTLKITMPNCPNCEADRLKWHAQGRISIGLFMMKEQHNDFKNQMLAGANIMYEYRLRKGLLFDPVKRPCIGESIVGSVALRGANDTPPTSECLTCDNLPENAPVMVEAKAQYKVSWLKGYPIIPSLSAGPAVSFNQGGKPAIKWGVVVTPEVEWIFLQKRKLPTLSGFVQHNLIIGSMPSNWRAGIRFYPGRQKK